MEKPYFHTKPSTEQELLFERERLLNLVDCKIRRRELTDARELAEELFRTEIEFAVLQKTKKFAVYGSRFIAVLILLVCILMTSIILTMLNIKPFFFFMVQAFTIASIIGAFLLNSLVLRDFETGVRAIIDAHESVKHSFMEKLLERSTN